MNVPPESPYPRTSSDQPEARSASQQASAIQVQRVRPVVTYSLIGVTVVVYLLQLYSISQFGIDYPAAYGAKVNELIQAGQLWRLITPVFLHSTSFYAHILFNMYALYSLGRGLEPEYGHSRFLALYLLGGFGGNVASFIMTPDASYGASTAIFGLLGAEAVLVYQNRRFLRNPRSVFLNIIAIAAINLILGFVNPGIDNWGHLGGLIAGTLYAWFAGPLWDVEGVSPNLRLVDRRPVNSILTAGVLVFALVAAAALYTIYARAQ
ncbi:MAG TPA: rhomboid family intramembrane serine protease [Anaerolineaceae bacterium]|nr:rhomboid family intramembrane serine protease [Anaerolineaceae bacterium]